ncbi:hypothetical protein BpHYR1_009719 [Brachionus plicatilis]|uniref:Uncharacterized protein n=1 Tax=Brachionus plicatilis TaxID=10195 RepID=A0A3M7PWP8_BRAPC|nr:hypothetical protein BpHYR1_009719 [Brachionus plicatilis]
MFNNYLIKLICRNIALLSIGMLQVDHNLFSPFWLFLYSCKFDNGTQFYFSVSFYSLGSLHS